MSVPLLLSISFESKAVPDDVKKQLEGLGVNVKVLKQYGLSDEDLAALFEHIVRMIVNRC
jgi:hypothetical protein